jgi:putative redox protein
MAKTVYVEWLKNRQFVGVDQSKHSVVMSSHDEENGIGVGMSQMLLLGLGGCTAYDVVGILEKKRQRLTGLTITVTGEQDEEAPWSYREIHMHYEVRGRGLSEKGVADAIRLSEERYCSIAATIRGVANITYDYTIVEEA